jgi:hypothetical protein
LFSCNPKEVFAPLDTITIYNKLNKNLICTIKTKEIKRKFNFSKGFFYEINDIRYNIIIKTSSINLKPNGSFVIMQVERHDEINIINIIKNVIDEILIIHDNAVIFTIDDILKNENIETIETNVNNWRVHDICIK